MYANPKKFLRSLARRKASKPKVATVKTVRRMIDKNEETHIFDYSSGSLTVGNAWDIKCISNVVKGDTVSDRSGDKITPKAISIRIDTATNSSNSTGDTLRVILFRDKQARGAVPSDTDLGLSNGGSENTNHFKAVDNYQGRFEKLYDKVHIYQTTHKQKYINIFKKLKGSMRFGTEGSDYENNALFIALCAKENTNKTVELYKSRLYFKDA